MALKKNLAVIIFAGTTLFGESCSREQSHNDYSAPKESCKMRVYSEWIDSNNNGVREENELVEYESFSLFDNIEFFIECSYNAPHIGRLSINVPEDECTTSLERPGPGEPYQSIIRLEDTHKKVGKYTIQFYVDDKLMCEKKFEIKSHAFVPSGIR